MKSYKKSNKKLTKKLKKKVKGGKLNNKTPPIPNYNRLSQLSQINKNIARVNSRLYSTLSKEKEKPFYEQINLNKYPNKKANNYYNLPSNSLPSSTVNRSGYEIVNENPIYSLANNRKNPTYSLATNRTNPIYSLANSGVNNGYELATPSNENNNNQFSQTRTVVKRSNNGPFNEPQFKN